MRMPHKLQNIILEIFALNAIALGLVIGTASISAFAADDDGADWKTPLAAEFSRLDTSGNGLLTPNEATKGHAFNRKTFAKADADHDGSIDQDEYIFFKTGQWPKDTQSTVQNNGMQNVPNQNVPNQDNTKDSPDKIIEKNPTGAGTRDNPNSNLKLDNELNSPDSNMLDTPANPSSPDSANPNSNGPEPINPDQAIPDSSTRGSIDQFLPPTVAELDRYTQQVSFQTSDSVSKENSDGKAIDDNVINTKAIATILDTDELEGIEISVETHQGEVLLDGFVKSEQDKMKTEYVVSMIDGVKSVKNYLKIRS